MASSRRSGLNLQIATYGSGGRDYTALATWEAATQADLTVSQVSPRLECYADSASYADSVIVAGSTTSADYNRSIIAASGHRHGGIVSTGVWFTATAGVINLQEDYASAQDVGATMTANSASAINTFSLIAGTDAAFIGCVAYNSTNNGTGGARGFLNQTSTSYFINCAAIKSKTEGFQLNAGTVYVYNCTSVGNTHGYRLATGATGIVVNSLSASNTTSNFASSGTSTGSAYNSSSSAAIFGSTGILTNQTFTFVNEASDDYHLSSLDQGARDRGLNLSADSIYAFDDDIGFTNRGLTWSIGFDEALTVGIPVAQANRRMWGGL